MSNEEKLLSVYDVLSSIDVREKVEEKNGLKYLSWAYAWGTLKEAYPDSTYKVYENRDELNYFTDGKTAWVKTGVTVQGIEYIEYLPVMDFKNKSIPVEKVTSFDVNKAIQRSLTKAIARHGLGLNIYAGEDLPMSEAEAKSVQSVKPDKDFIKEAIKACKTEDELSDLYQHYKEEIINDDKLLEEVTLTGKILKRKAA